MEYLLWIVASAFAFAIGEYYSKIFGNTHNVQYAILATLAYMVGSVLWFPAIWQRNHLAIVGTIWSVVTLVVTVVVGVVAFNEKLSQTAWVGIAMAIGSIVMLSGE